MSMFRRLAFVWRGRSQLQSLLSWLLVPLLHQLLLTPLVHKLHLLPRWHLALLWVSIVTTAIVLGTCPNSATRGGRATRVVVLRRFLVALPSQALARAPTSRFIKRCSLCFAALPPQHLGLLLGPLALRHCHLLPDVSHLLRS